MARITNPVIGELSPNIYKAVNQANLDPQSQQMIEQFSYTVKAAKKLRNMNADAAKKEFRSLTEDAQQSIRAIYPDAEFTKEDPSLLQRGLGVIGTVAKGLASPIISTFKVAEEYGKAINTGYSAARQIQQGANPFAKKTWSDAYNGKELYDKGSVAILEEKYGKEMVLVAKGLLAGKTPGEVIEEYGKVDEKITQAIVTAFDEEDKFKLIMKDVGYARTSPGRDFIRDGVFEEKPVIENNWINRFFFGDKPTQEQIDAYKRIAKRSSGAIDAVYQVVVDPLTYVTGGTTKAATKGAEKAAIIANEAKKGNYKGSVKNLFDEPDIRQVWDGLGEQIKKFSDAPTTAEKTAIRRQIGQDYPGVNSDTTLNLFSDNKIFDADSARDFFAGDVQNAKLLLSDTVDGITYMRNGVITARNQRHVSAGMASVADSIFNPSAVNKGVADRMAKLEAEGKSKLDILRVVGEEIDLGVNRAGVETFLDIDKDIKKARRLAEITGKLMARNPGSDLIYLGKDADKSLNTVRLVARQVFTRDIADYVAFEWGKANVDEQIVILRNLYGAVMYRYGLHGTVEGKRLMKEVLGKTFANMTTTPKTPVPKNFAEQVSEHTLRIENDVPFLNARGGVQPGQLAKAIGTLPYEQIMQVAAKTARKDSIPAIFDGATRNKYVSEFVNFWTILTLFPRLGIRSAIDEAFMYAFSAPAQDLFRFASADIRKQKNVLTALTGSMNAVGPIKRGINKAFRSGGPENALSPAERATIARQLADDLGVPVEEITHMQIREETVARVYAMYGVDASMGNYKYIKEAFVYHPDTLNSMASSIAARTSLGGRFDKNVMDAVFTPSTLTQALNDAAIKVGQKFRIFSTEELRRVNDKYLTLAHFDAWYRQMVPNVKTFNDTVVDPTTSFFRNNGLRTPKDFAIARTEMLESIGVKYDWETKQFNIDPKRKETADAFINEFADSAFLRQRKVGDAEIARIHIENMLLDMRNTFHGGPESFNDDLFNLMVERHNRLVAYEMETGKTVKGKWSKAAANIEFADFERATVGKQPTGEINTALEFVELIDGNELPNMWSKFGDAIMESMDRQVNGLFRQPAILTTYGRLREGYTGFQDEFVNQLMRGAEEANPRILSDDKLYARTKDQMEDLARKRYTEIAMQEAADSVLKYVDNPNIRSNFALSTRTVARFYRATEDFWRRYYRLMREKPLQVIYRMRLAHQGLSARGEVHYDEKGEPYVVLPTDSIINGAVEPVMRKFTGGSFKVPQFNDVTLKLRLINPSFSPEAGQPGLSGPVAALSFIGFRSFLGYMPGKIGDAGEFFADEFDTYALGNLGDNMTFKKALMPLFLQNLYDIMPKSELSRQETTAAFQAIAYTQAFGGPESRLPENPTDVQRDKFIRDIKIASHNVIAMRAILGMISPVSPTLRESKGVPDYIKNTGIVNLRAEFFDILSGIAKTESDTVFDPYELAVAMFVGKNPGKIIYTVSRNEKTTKVLIQKTDQVKNWSTFNKGFINAYGETAFIFAPQVGDYTASAYAWLEGQDLIKSPKLEDYLKNVEVARAKQAYFDIERQEKEALDSEFSIPMRKAIIDSASARRNSLKTGNPLLRAALETGGFEVATEEGLLSSIEQAIVDKGTPINSDTRKKMSIATKMVREFITFSNDPQMRLLWNFSDSKRAKRAAIEEQLNVLMQSDLSVKEANRAVFAPILGFYSRDTYSAGGR
jgi:hypothetical protein